MSSWHALSCPLREGSEERVRELAGRLAVPRGPGDPRAARAFFRAASMERVLSRRHDQA